MRATEVVTYGDLRSDRVRGEDAGTIRMRAQAVWLRRWGCVDYCDFLHVEVTPCGYPPVPDIDVGVTHCGYPPVLERSPDTRPLRGEHMPRKGFDRRSPSMQDIILTSERT